MVAAIALGMAGAPVLAQPSTPASKLSVSAAATKSVRTGAAVDGSDARGSSVILAIGALGLIVLGVVLAAGGGNDPVSP